MNGLILWLALGLLAGAIDKLLPGPPLSWPASLLTGLGGGLAGGLLATALGMGGIAELDLRSGVVSFLFASMSVLFLQILEAWRRKQ
jgi:uncharacterized membrane protein YeaQ/YmgE (transglycosylase-associated protein family)